MTRKEATKMVMEITRRLCRRERIVLRNYIGKEFTVECCHIHWPHRGDDDFGVGCRYITWHDDQPGRCGYAVFGQGADSWIYTSVIATRFNKRGASRLETIWSLNGEAVLS